MGSISDLKLPFIDFSEATEAGTAAWADVRAQVRKAMEEFGCFEARFDRVPLDLQNGTLRLVEELFELPLDTKRKYVSTKSVHRYSVAQYREYPAYESMGIDDANVVENVDAFGCIFWPEGRPDLSKTLHSCAEKLSELEKTIRRMIMESFGVEKHLEEQLNSTTYFLRMLKYKSPKSTEIKVGLAEHTDKGMITILYQNQVEGALEIKTKDGNWISLKSSLPQSFVVMLGDSFHAWANGRLHTPYHRVVMTGNEDRYSIGLFSSSKGTINAPEELVDDEHPQLFKPFDYINYIDFIRTDEGIEAQRAGKSTLKAYSGVI